MAGDSKTKPAQQSIICVQLAKLCPQLRCDTLQTGEVELADLAPVAVAQPPVLRFRAQNACAQHLLEVADAQPGTLDRPQKLLQPGRGEGRLDGGMDRAIVLGIRHRNHSLLAQCGQLITPASKTSVIRPLWTIQDKLERETGIEPATNSLEG